jgi:hypothetical protein
MFLRSLIGEVRSAVAPLNVASHVALVVAVGTLGIGINKAFADDICATVLKSKALDINDNRRVKKPSVKRVGGVRASTTL